MIKKWIIKLLKRCIRMIEEQEDTSREVDYEWLKDKIYEVNKKDRNEYV